VTLSKRRRALDYDAQTHSQMTMGLETIPCQFRRNHRIEESHCDRTDRSHCMPYNRADASRSAIGSMRLLELLFVEASRSFSNPLPSDPQ